jgi:hypothetical protein
VCVATVADVVDFVVFVDFVVLAVLIVVASRNPILDGNDVAKRKWKRKGKLAHILS